MDTDTPNLSASDVTSLSSLNLPSTIDMAANLAATLKDTALSFLKSGKVMVYDDVKNGRLQICNSCDAYIKEQKRCSRCGCFMETKARMSGAKCPIDKW